ncbi:OmpA family protein [Epibacterium sp. DP7N7-1]|nr:OmpA family protein [Epibacterium sp. DP7N7-1]
MSSAKMMTGRRAFILGAAAASLMGMGGVAIAQQAKVSASSTADQPINEWAGRELKSWERYRLSDFAEHLNKSLAEIPVKAVVLQNHVRIRIPASIGFVPGKDALNPDGVAILTLVSEQLADQKLVRVEIVAHHDARPTDYEAYTFTQRRAMAAKAALISRGISEKRLKSTGLGSKFPYTSAKSPENQRIELIVRPL